MKRYVLALLLITLSSGLNALAGDFSVSPVHVHLSKRHKIATLIITNLHSSPLTVQASALSWRQKNGVNIYSKSNNLIISPPLFSIQPHEQQIVRVGWMSTFPKKTERDLRLILHEVPKPQKPGYTGVQLVLRMVLPIFVAPIDPGNGSLLSATLINSSKCLLVHITNSGNIHGVVTHLVVYSGKAIVTTKNVLDYVLPHAFYNIRIPLTRIININKRVRIALDTIQDGREIKISAAR